MKLETFFEKFDQFADAPNAVAKMRELVLKLAVQGKLVEQFPSDEPASRLLERIQQAKERLIQERAIRRQETDSIDCDSAPFPIPQSWAWTRLGEIGDWGSGSTPPRGNHDLYDGGITWLKSGELNDNLALAGSSETVTELALKTGSFRRNQPGDVLFAMYGATIGKVAILAEPAVTNQAVCGCTPFEGVLSRYLFNYLVSQRAAFHEASEGGAQPNLSKVKVVAFPFPLPPLAEQKRIVAKVDELMALCDRLEAQQQERAERKAALARAALARFADAPTPANLELLFYPSPCPRASVRKTKTVSHKGTEAQSPAAYLVSPADLRKTILTLAVQGKLVPQDPNDEPAEELLARLARELTPEQRRKQSPPLAPLSKESLQYELPENWKWARFRDAAIIASNLVKPDDFLDFTHLAPDNIEKGNGVLLPCRTVREDKVISSNHRFYPGQIIYSKIRPNLAKVVVVGFEGLCSADMYPIDALIDSFYLQCYMLSESFLVQAVKTDTRVAMPKINQMELNAIAVPAPPPRRTAPDRGEGGASDGLGRRVGSATRRLPRRRGEAPYRPRRGTDRRKGVPCRRLSSIPKPPSRRSPASVAIPVSMR
jgi:type I restriction enzyme S subunit